LILLDENILDSQRVLLAAARVATRQIGLDIGRKGMKDEEIVVLMRRRRNITFFTRDAGFYQRGLRHHRYCLVVMNVAQNEVATFVRRFLRHPDFETQVKRTGRVVRVSHGGLAVWRLRSQSEVHTAWSPSR
jgi:hypothetical protein